MNEIINELHNATPDQRASLLAGHLESVCGFGKVFANITEAHEKTKSSLPTITSILAWLLNSDNLLLSGSGIQFDHLPAEIERCSLIPTNIPNLFDLADDYGKSQGFIIIRSPSLGCEYVASSLYEWSCDRLYLSLCISHVSDWDAIVRDIYGHTGLLNTGSEDLFMESKPTRMAAQTKISRRLSIVPYYHNGIDHLGHYFMNFLGPLSRHISSNILPSNSVLLIGSCPSWFGGIEFAEVLPRIDGFSAIQKNAILVRGWADAGKVCELISAGLFQVQGSCISLALSKAMHQYLDGIAMKRAVDSPVHNTSSLTIGIGLRGGTRSILNIIDLIEAVIKRLSKKTGQAINIVIDGMCSSKMLVENITTQQVSLDLELQQAQEIILSMEKIGVSAISTVGKPIVNQLADLSFCDAVLTHSGSGSAKYLWALNKPTIVLNYPYHHNYRRYNSSEDQYCDGMTSLLFGRAFRGEHHADEWYLSRELCTNDPEVSSHYRPNSYIDIECASAEILDILIELSSKRKP